MEKVDFGVIRAVEVRRREKVPEQEQTAEHKQAGKVRFAEEERSEKVRAQSADEQAVTSGPD